MSIATLPRRDAPRPGRTIADLLEQLGNVPSNRVLLDPQPGEATEKDVLDRKERFGQLCELIDGVLVEKTMGWEESAIAMELGYHLKRYLKRRPIGILLGMDGPVRTVIPQVRMPDLSFIRKGRIKGKPVRRPAVMPLPPDLAVEVLSGSNSPGEMNRKLGEYFDAGVQVVWFIDPSKRTARIYTSRRDFEEIDEGGYLTGGKLLPGFKVRLKTLLDDALDV